MTFSVSFGARCADDASLVPGIVDLRHDLPGLNGLRDPSRPQQCNRLRRQFNFERQRLLERRHELAGLLQLVEHDCPERHRVRFARRRFLKAGNGSTKPRDKLRTGIRLRPP